MANNLDHSSTTTNSDNTDKQPIELESFDWASKPRKERVRTEDESKTCSLDDGECLGCGA